jgi:hypothetical protein
MAAVTEPVVITDTSALVVRDGRDGFLMPVTQISYSP